MIDFCTGIFVFAELRLAARGRDAEEEEVSTSGRLSLRSDPDAAYVKKVFN